MLCSPRAMRWPMASSSAPEITVFGGCRFMSTSRTAGSAPAPMREGMASRT
ncbi:hypothetical protein D9M69_545620 [compost metagenome]